MLSFFLRLVIYLLSPIVFGVAVQRSASAAGEPSAARRSQLAARGVGLLTRLTHTRDSIRFLTAARHCVLNLALVHCRFDKPNQHEQNDRDRKAILAHRKDCFQPGNKHRLSWIDHYYN